MVKREEARSRGATTAFNWSELRGERNCCSKLGPALKNHFPGRKTSVILMLRKIDLLTEKKRGQSKRKERRHADNRWIINLGRPVSLSSKREEEKELSLTQGSHKKEVCLEEICCTTTKRLT